MGYHTEFSGQFAVTPALSAAHAEYLTAFSQTRRIKRLPAVASELPDVKRERVGLPIGEEGEFFVGGTGFQGQDDDGSVVAHNVPPCSQPGLWCQWAPTEDRTAIEWDGVEKFYAYAEWLDYILENFLTPWSYTVDGEVEWSGDERGDLGKLVVVDNVLTVLIGHAVYE